MEGTGGILSILYKNNSTPTANSLGCASKTLITGWVRWFKTIDQQFKLEEHKFMPKKKSKVMPWRE